MIVIAAWGLGQSPGWILEGKAPKQLNSLQWH